MPNTQSRLTGVDLDLAYVLLALMVEGRAGGVDAKGHADAVGGLCVIADHDTAVVLPAVAVWEGSEACRARSGRDGGMGRSTTRQRTI